MYMQSGKQYIYQWGKRLNIFFYSFASEVVYRVRFIYLFSAGYKYMGTRGIRLKSVLIHIYSIDHEALPSFISALFKPSKSVIM